MSSHWDIRSPEFLRRQPSYRKELSARSPEHVTNSRYIQISAPVQPGNSGGPLLDTSGHIVGIVSGKLNAMRVQNYTGDIPQNVNFAIKGDTAKAFLESRAIKYETARSDQQLSAADVADLGRPFTAYIECRNTPQLPSARSEPSQPGSSAPTRGPSSFWSHNGSIVYLIAEGLQREFRYYRPREVMLQAGARPDSLLFTGKSENDGYVGTAFIFNPRCGQIPYTVSGPILDNYRRVRLRGRAPRMGSDCRIKGYLTDTLEFTLIGKSLSQPTAAAPD